jgi:tryptophan synthase alpha chain
MNRIKTLFQQLKRKREGSLICYLPVISTDLSISMDVADVYAKGGVDLVELAIPSDRPWLDGPVIQRLHLNARARRVSPDTAFAFGRLVRSKYPQWPITPMTDYSVIVSYGTDRFVEQCTRMEADAVEIPDYPVFSAGDPHAFRTKIENSHLDFISFCDGLSQSQETSPEYQLFSQIVKGTRGFLFLMASPGVTGKREHLASDYLKRAVENIRKVQNKEKNDFPVIVGFGLSTPEHVRRVVNEVGADGVVIGSAVSELILAHGGQKELVDFVRSIKQATRID